MAVISPFSGIRYNNELVKNLADVITPPYDVIDSDKQDHLYKLSEYNHIRLEYGLEGTGDNSEGNRYTRSAAFFSEWLNNSVLIQENKPVMYWYEQSFTWEGIEYSREGLITTMQVEPYEKKTVLPHEETLSKPKEDRLELMRHCQANFSPIFGLYPDKQGKVDSICHTLKMEKPLIDFTDLENQHHRIWLIENSAIHNSIAEMFQPWQIILADGHHRYETALAYSKEQKNLGLGGYDKVMVILVNLYSPGLLILPTHRVINNLPSFNKQALMEKLKESFYVYEFGEADYSQLKPFLNELKSKGNGKCSIGISDGSHLYHLVLKDVDADVERLDADILQEYIFEKHMGLSADDLKMGEVISFTRSEQEALQLVIDEKAQATFFLNPPLMKHVLNSVQSGQRLPQKSTYFYPKLVSGLVINKISG